MCVSLPWIDPWERQDQLVAALLDFARSQTEAPILFPQTDAALFLASRYRGRLAECMRMMLADRDLIDQPVDKRRLQALAARHDLPVPPAQHLRPAPGDPPPALDVPYAVVVKPLTRIPAWAALAGSGKALRVPGRDDLAALWPRLTKLRTEFLAQQLVRGPESRTESFHVYVDVSGAIVGEFTGRKIRTFPRDYGHSTAVEIVSLPDVAEVGRDVVARLDVRGVAKLDFKRDDHGRLHLLEINPRFNLWHHPGAVAGVNLPAMVYADVTGRERPSAERPPRHVVWCDPLGDMRAAYAQGISPLAWLRWARGCDAICGLSRDDPLPFLRGRLWPAVSRRVVSVARSAAASPSAPLGPPGRPGSFA